MVEQPETDEPDGDRTRRPSPISTPGTGQSGGLVHFGLAFAIAAAVGWSLWSASTSGWEVPWWQRALIVLGALVGVAIAGSMLPDDRSQMTAGQRFAELLGSACTFAVLVTLAWAIVPVSPTETWNSVRGAGPSECPAPPP